MRLRGSHTAKKGGGGKRRGGRKRRGRAGAVVSITGIVGILLLLNRLGIVTTAFWVALQAGNLGGMMSVVESALTNNFGASGIGVTIGIFVAYAIIAMVVKFALKGKTVPLRGKPRAIGA